MLDQELSGLLGGRQFWECHEVCRLREAVDYRQDHGTALGFGQSRDEGRPLCGTMDGGEPAVAEEVPGDPGSSPWPWQRPDMPPRTPLGPNEPRATRTDGSAGRECSGLPGGRPGRTSEPTAGPQGVRPAGWRLCPPVAPHSPGTSRPGPRSPTGW